MRVLALVSGGKDSCFNMIHCIHHGHEIVGLANLKSNQFQELDSYMYQTVGGEGLAVYSEALGLPLFQSEIVGNPIETRMDYVENSADEVEDLFRLLVRCKEHLDFYAVSAGAIFSQYQFDRVAQVCKRLNLIPLCYLWHADQVGLLDNMLECGIEAIVVKVAVVGLGPKHLGKSLEELRPQLLKLRDQYGINVCGEGGEFESLVLDCPLFRQRLIIDESTVVMHDNNPVAPVAYLRLPRLHLKSKPGEEQSKADWIKAVSMLNLVHWIDVDRNGVPIYKT